MIERALDVDIAMLRSPPIGAIGQEPKAISFQLRQDGFADVLRRFLAPDFAVSDTTTFTDL